MIARTLRAASIPGRAARIGPGVRVPSLAYGAKGRCARAAETVRPGLSLGRSRLRVAAIAFCLCFALIGLRLVDLTVMREEGGHAGSGSASGEALLFGRADIVDRHGQLLAKSLPVASLYADPKLMLAPQAAARALVRIFPDLAYDDVHARLTSDRRFVWIKRHIRPELQQRVHELGFPGLAFKREGSRFYPHEALTAHVIGYTDIDGKGLAGIERGFDQRLRTEAAPLQLSLDIRLQHILKREMQAQIEEFQAIGGTGLIFDVNTAEVLAMVSLPDFDPHAPPTDQDDAMFNQATLGVYEMGSTFKIFNTALALQSGRISLGDSFDATKPVSIAGHQIHDFHGEHRWLTVPEIFKYSSNIGSVRMVQEVGIPLQKAFMQRIGFFEPAPVELPEAGRPLIPDRWREINMATIAFGHGISVTPLHLVSGTAAMINGGIMRPPTVLKRAAGQVPEGDRVISSETSSIMRRLMRLVVKDGTARKADVPGYVVGGKTGTAEKQVGRRYQGNKRLSSLIAAFPMQAPQYVVYILIDEPKPSKHSYGYATGGWVAGPAIARIIAEIGPMLGVRAVDEDRPEIAQTVAMTVPKRDQNLAALTASGR